VATTSISPEKTVEIGTLGNKALALWEIASVSSSFLIVAWFVYAYVEHPKLVGALPVALAFALIFLSHSTRQESPKEIGLRVDNLGGSAKLLALPMLAGAVLILVIGGLSGTIHFDLSELKLRFLWLPVWGFIQEYVMQGYINRRAQLILGRGVKSVLAVAMIFALFHLPNLWLTLSTLCFGIVWAAVYQRVPNLFALGLSHAVMSLLAVTALPSSAFHGFRVGFKYFGYNYD
jgi:membrane protease YdiL (CAAX protease family)